MVAKVKAAAWARRDKDFVINARTDARQKYGPEEVVRRAKAYWEAGADLIFLEAPQSKDELKYYASELVPLGVRISANMLDGGRTPLVTFKELEELGYSRCSVPVMPTYAAAMGMKLALEKMMTDGHNQNLGDLIIPFADFNKIVGLPEIRSIEERFLTQCEIKNKYGSKEQLEAEKTAGR
jgi:2-methylisocitrate lyase-like PEP mutase family enzyme